MEWPAVISALVGAASASFAAYLYYRFELRKRELTNAERIKALEVGRPVPDAEIAQANVATNRAWAAAAVGIVVPLFAFGAALTTTVLLLVWGGEEGRLPLLCTVWGVSGLVSLLTVILSLKALQSQRAPRPMTPDNVPDLKVAECT